MKTAIVILASLALPAAGQITATFEIVETSTGNPVGDVVIELQYAKAPQTVANFITLAEGTRSSYDPATGAVKPKRYYAGESFYRVVNNPGFKIAQTGSGNGTNSGGPGYTFRDEFIRPELAPPLTHQPYILAMANGGPNTNGSQIYLTGSDAIPSLDGKHTVFGIVSDATSQGVIGQIMAAGNNGTTIQEVTIERIGTEAQAFDEFAQSLPTCQAVPGTLAVDNSGGFNNVFYTPAINVTGDSVFRVFKTTNLDSWNFEGQLPPGSPLVAGDPIGFPVSADSKAFYNISLLRNPNALRQEFLAGRTMALAFTGGNTYNLIFDSSGTSGVLQILSDPVQTFSFQLLNHAVEAYGSTLILSPFPLPVLRVVAGYDNENEVLVSGRHSTSQWNGLEFNPFGTGTLTLSN
jgi:peptidyl-prolyl cis-trans isomerase A (cyclophilin A)